MMTDTRLYDRMPMGRRFAGQDAAAFLRGSVGVPAPRDFYFVCTPATFYDGIRYLPNGGEQRGIDIETWEGCGVTGKATGAWGAGDMACTLSAAYLAARARGYVGK